MVHTGTNAGFVGVRWAVTLCVVAFLHVTSATESNDTAITTCRRAPKPVFVDSLRRQDSDGITRTPGSNCRASDGLTCDLCCNGRCCEDFSGTDNTLPSASTQYWIPLRFAVVSRTADTFTRLKTEGKIDENLRALNRVFESSRLWFYASAVVHYNDTRMVDSCNTDPCYVSNTCDFYTYTIPRVKGDNSREALLMVCDEITYLGEAQFPWAAVEDSEYQYLQVHAKTIGIEGPSWPTGLGHTLVHEMGHYFGLFHVFETSGRCNDVGDWVGDTNAASSAASRTLACDASYDTCADRPGLDPINNFMNYARDECMTEFTTGQRQRMQQGFRRYRPILLANTVVDAGNCPPSATTLSECSCTNGASPSDRCVVTAAPTTTVGPATTATVIDPPPVTTTSAASTTQAAVNATTTTATPLIVRTDDDDDDGMSSEATIATIVGASAVGIVMVIALVCCIVHRKTDKERAAAQQNATPPPPQQQQGGPPSRGLNGGSPVEPLAQLGAIEYGGPNAGAWSRPQHTSNPNVDAHDHGVPPLAVIIPKRDGGPKSSHARVSTAEILEREGSPTLGVASTRSTVPMTRAGSSPLMDGPQSVSPGGNESGASASREMTTSPTQPSYSRASAAPGKLVKQGSAIPRSEFSDAESDDPELGLSPDVTAACRLGPEDTTTPTPSAAAATAACAAPRDSQHAPDV